MESYHKKFSSLCRNDKEFTGRIFTNDEFLHHLTNINFHFECGELYNLQPEVLSKIKSKFSFQGYSAGIDGLDQFDEKYEDNFKAFVQECIDKYA